MTLILMTSLPLINHKKAKIRLHKHTPNYNAIYSVNAVNGIKRYEDDRPNYNAIYSVNAIDVLRMTGQNFNDFTLYADQITGVYIESRVIN